MTHPLENYRKIAAPNFISQMEYQFYTDYYHELNSGLYVDIDKDNNRMKITGVDIYGKDFSTYISFTFYLLTEYEKLEKESRSEIDKIILNLLDEKKQQVFIKAIIAELQTLHDAIKELVIKPEYTEYRNLLLRDSVRYCELLKAILQQPNLSTNNSTPKIQWLGKTNILATLIYDLWQGQDKGKGTSTRPMIKADKKDLEQLIINNFLDSKGKPLTISTISDYLNTNKDKAAKRAKRGIRIELDC